LTDYYFINQIVAAIYLFYPSVFPESG